MPYTQPGGMSGEVKKKVIHTDVHGEQERVGFASLLGNMAV